MNIDWSKAPKGATHGRYVAGGTINHYKIENGQIFFYNNLCDAWIDSTDRIFELIDIAQDWVEGDLPPVGTVCEIATISDDWVKIIVVAITDYRIYCEKIGDDEPAEFCPVKKYARFRHARTPEQIAAEKREKTAEYLHSRINPHSKWHKCPIEIKDRYRALVDEGYGTKVDL